MYREMIKLLDNITVTFILTIPYSNSDIYVSGLKKTDQEKKGKKRKWNSKPFFLDNVVVIIVSTLGQKEHFCKVIYYY